VAGVSHWEGVEASQTAVDEVSRCPGINLSVLDKQVMNGSVPFVSLFFFMLMVMFMPLCFI